MSFDPSIMGAVAAGHPDTAEAAAEILREGGNAIDAAIAAVLASAISEPPLTGLGGGGIATIRTAEGKTTSVDFFVTTPGKGLELNEEVRTRGFKRIDVDFGGRIQTFHVGGGTVTVPGVPAGMEYLSKHYGTLPMSRLIEPARKLAVEGSKVSPALNQMFHILRDIVCGSDMGKKTFSNEGKVLPAGSVYTIPGAANFLDDFAKYGSESFYKGDIAQSMVRAVRDAGGYLTAEDLSSYEVIERAPEEARFGAVKLIMPPAPSLGGPLIAFGLQLVADEANELKQLNYRTLLRLSAAMAISDAYRQDEMDPQLLTEYRSLSHREEDVVAKYKRRYAEALQDPKRLAKTVRSNALGNTTHTSITSRDGSVCSVTTTNGEGSTVWLEELGIHINNMLGEEDLHPGAFHQYSSGVRLPSMMTPTIAMTPDGRTLALGTGGSNRIRSAILQVVLHYLARGLSLKEAIEFPRIHLEQGVLDVEPGFKPTEIDKLEEVGLNIQRWNQTNLYFGGVHGVGFNSEGLLSAVGDPRRGGVGLVVKSTR